MMRGRIVERENFEPTGEALDLAAIGFRGRRFRRPVQELRQDDRRNRQGFHLKVEFLAQRRRTIAQDANAEIRVEQESEHQSGSRS